MMLDNIRDINTLTNFNRNTLEFLRQLKEAKEPIILTINGKAELVVRDAGSYQKLWELAERVRVLEGIQQGLEEMEAGRGRPADEVFEEIQRDFEGLRDA